jgi:ATP-dependent Lhr-like helicase
MHEWCDRRLLARIHRLTMQGLRAQIRPVEPREFLQYLLRRHHLVPDSAWGGPVAVRETIAQLQGFELPAGAWESRVLSARIAEYDPAWLDNLFLSGEVMWGRLNRPRRGDDARPSMAALSRVIPISLVLREELPLLLETVEPPSPGEVRSGAERVLEALTARGALFFGELSAATQLLSGHLEQALRELAALGLATSDAFAAVRKIAGDRAGSKRRARRPLHGVAAPIGRWSLFPGTVQPVSREKHVEHWCRQLLRRYGVVFRDLLARETAAPAWPALVGTFRRMELRGDVRGGRFVSQVSGEQYALPEEVERLRQSRDRAGTDPWIVISAADPVNLFGTVIPGPRIPATHRNALIVQGGRMVASRQAGVAEFHEPVDQATQWAMRRAMTTGRREASVAGLSEAGPGSLTPATVPSVTHTSFERSPPAEPGAKVGRERAR